MPDPAQASLSRRFVGAVLGYWLIVALAISPLAAADASKVRFDLPADSAEVALKSLSQQSGVEVLFPTEAVAGVRTNPVRGEMTARQALDAMLAGTVLIAVEGKSTASLSVRRKDDERPSAGADAASGPLKKNETEPAPASLPMKRNNIFAQLAASLALAAAPAHAQTVTTQSSSSSGDAGEPAVALSPFTVSAERDDGYLAGETLAGSRVKTPLKDTAASISIMTEEFIRDIAATTLTEALRYGNNVQLELNDAGVLGSSTDDNATFSSFDTFRIRGQTATVARNYFAWRLPADTFNIERIEESRGPNSVLFGVASAGGVISYTTKSPVTGRSFREGSFSAGTYGTYRGTIDINQAALGGKLGVRFNAVADRTADYRQFAHKQTPRADIAAKYVISPRTSIRVEYEAGKIHEIVKRNANMLDGGVLTYISLGRPTYATPVAANGGAGLGRLAATRHLSYIANNKTLVDMSLQNVGFNSGDQLGNDLAVDKSVNPAGPGAKRDAPFNALSTFFEQQLARHTFLELAYNHQDYHMKVYQPFGDTNRLDADPDRTLKNGTPNPFVGRFFMDGPWVRRQVAERADNYRATLSHELNLEKWGNYRFAGMGEYEVRKLESRADIEVIDVPSSPTAPPEGAANQVYRRNYVTEGVWSTYYVDGPTTTGLLNNTVDAVSGQAFSSKWVAQNANPISDPSKQKTLLFGSQARYFKGRLVGGFGYRRDFVDYLDRDNVRNATTGEWEVDWAKGTQFHWVAETRTYSAVAHVTSKISLLYNHSSNIGLPNTVRILPLNTIAPPAKGEGEDAGLILNLLEDKLYFRAVYYHSAQKGAADFRFGGATGPQSISTFILNALQSAGFINQATNDAHRSTASGGTYDRTSKGYEFTLTASPTKNLRLHANFSITDTVENNTTPEIVEWMAKEFAFYRGFNAGSVVTADAGATVDAKMAQMQLAMDQSKELDGLPTSGGRRYKVNTFARYSFSSGWFKGLMLGGGYTHQSKNIVGRDPVTRELFYGNSYWLADALVGYRFSRTPLLKRLSLQMNVTNLFDNRDNLVLRLRPTNPDKPTVQFNPGGREVQRYAIQAPRTFRFSMNFAF